MHVKVAEWFRGKRNGCYRSGQMLIESGGE